MRLEKIILIGLIVVFVITSAFVKPISGIVVTNDENDPPFLEIATDWADSIFNTLSPDERIGQLFMVAAYSNKDSTHIKRIQNLIYNQKIGGIIFMQGGPLRQAELVNSYQRISKVPLMISIDGEWGLAMRLDSTVKYPWQMTLGAIQDEQLIYKMGVDIGNQCRRLGIHVNFAPVVDVNVNPKNPIINARSFGENRENVASKGIAYMKGMQSVNVMANAKHFPGHGDTDKDSHKSLPTINHSKARMDSVELYPFYKLIENGLASIMVAHLYIPAYVKEYNMATTLSKNVVTDLLQDSLGFKGLIFTDALSMKGVSSLYRSGVVDLKALLAGNDVLLFSENVELGIAEINKAIVNGEITREEVDKRCLKILRAKQWEGLGNYKKVELKNLYNDLNKRDYELLNRKLSEASLTVLLNKGGILPLKKLETLKVASLSIGEGGINEFQNTLSLYNQVDHFTIKELKSKKNADLLDTLRMYNTIIVSIHKSNKNPWKSYKIAAGTKDMISNLALNNKVILTIFANAYSLLDFRSAEKVDGLIMAYQNSSYANQAAAQLIFGGIGANGRLPVSVSNTIKEGAGIDVEPINRFKYTVPEEVGINLKDLYRIDSIVMSGINEHAYPGCQILIAKSGKVFYNKSFGHHTYERKRSVVNSDIYDLASVTKISASILSAMCLRDEGKFSLDNNLCDYLPDLIPDSSIYINLNLREILAHQSGLQAWVPFYLKTMVKGIPRYDIYSLDSSATYPFRVAENFYIHKYYPDTIYQRILRGPLKEKKYRYSDLGYYFMMKIIEKQTGEKLKDYVGKIYAQMGMSTTGYIPRERFDIDRIPPTEYDMIFRKQLIKGDVHDPGSAMLGGVGGHAGVFSNANDLAKLMQMYLNGGTYGGVRYIKDTTLNEFTKCQFCYEEKENRRAAGFDKPFLQGYGGPTCDGISQKSFGHTGFTGTMAWADPDEEIVYVFLSNRVYPDADNKKLLKMNIRTNIQQVIYEAIKKGKNGKIN
ncbi:MAG: serine hydrolase [Flavobacteriales bacterium]|nr:MAG: serine hydrolase [Flavobacteriales bacterium]